MKSATNRISKSSYNRDSAILLSLPWESQTQQIRHRIFGVKNLLNKNKFHLSKRFKSLQSCCNDERLANAINSGLAVMNVDQRYCEDILERAANLVHDGRTLEAWDTLESLNQDEHNLLMEQEESEADRWVRH